MNEMKVLIEYPPNIDKIDDILHCKNDKVFYCYGDTIYNPFDLPIPNAIYHHELAHSVSQAGDPEGWWDKYLTDLEFRYQEELDGHHAEMMFLLPFTIDREDVNRLLVRTAIRLTSRVYGYTKSRIQAQKDLKSFRRAK